MRFTLQTKTKKGGERNPQRPYVCLLVHSNFSSKHSHSVSYRSKTIQLPVVWIQMHNKWWPQETHTDTFRREALHLHAVWVLLHNSSWPQKTHRPPLHGAGGVPEKYKNTQIQSIRSLSLYLLCSIYNSLSDAMYSEHLSGYFHTFLIAFAYKSLV